jgi:proton glutamate symport protein
MKPKLSLGLALFVGLLGAILATVVAYSTVVVPAWLLIGTRWGAVAVLVFYVLARRSLTLWIFFAMVLGILVGLDLPDVAKNLDVLSKIFIKLIKAVIGPLVFATLVVGIAGNKDLKQVGRMGAKSLGYFISATLVALVIGLLAANISQPGVGVTAPANLPETAAAKASTWREVLLHIFPENIAKSVAEGQILQIVIFSVLFGIGLTQVRGAARATMLRGMESLAQVMFKFTNVVMYLAPLGAGGALAYAVGSSGLGVLADLFQLVATLYVALAAFILLVLLPIALLVRVPIRTFLKAITEPVSIAFATASSEAALPKAMEQMERIGTPRKVVSFVMPTGYSFNLDGTTLYLSLATLFVAQAAGVHFGIGQQIVIMLTLLVTSKGVAGVARASLVILSATAADFGLPDWPIALILGVDVLMDMGRTAVNVIGNCLASIVIARWEGEFDDAKAANPDWTSPMDADLEAVGH